MNECIYMCVCNVSQSQNKLDVWDAETSRDPLHSVKAHTRAVRLATSSSHKLFFFNVVIIYSDLNWSYSDAHCIASCSVDSFVYTWDVRYHVMLCIS